MPDAISGVKQVSRVSRVSWFVTRCVPRQLRVRVRETDPCGVHDVDEVGGRKERPGTAGILRDRWSHTLSGERTEPHHHVPRTIEARV